jgi:hypothetical protein
MNFFGLGLPSKIPVTVVPNSGNEVAGASVQLAVNVVALALAGVATLAVQHRATGSADRSGGPAVLDEA